MWLLLGSMALAHVPVLVFAGPDDDWCGVFRDATQGDLVLLAPGDYYGPCDLVGKAPDPLYKDELSVFAAQDDKNRPRFHWDGVSPYILSISDEQVQVAWLEFVGVPEGVTAIDVRSSWAPWILDVDFFDVAGTAIGTSGSADYLRIADVTITGTGTGISVGCPGCVTTDLQIEDSQLAGLATGVRVEDGSGLLSAVVTDGGTGLDLGGEVLVEETLVRGDVLLRGPVTLDGTIVIGRTATAPGATGTKLYGNTFYDPGLAALDLAGWGDGSVLQNNAIAGEVPDVGGAAGNVGCPDPSACWIAPENLDLYPVADGPLTAGTVTPDAGYMTSDWCGFEREDPVTAGALEDLGEPIAPLAPDSPKTTATCHSILPDDPEPPEVEDTATEPPADEKSGCDTGSSGAPTLGGLLVALVGLRRAARRRGSARSR